MNKWIYFSIFILSFCIGAIIWYLTSYTVSINRSSVTKKLKKSGVLLYVNDYPITVQDLDWEYSLLTKEIFTSEELLPMPDINQNFDELLEPLKEKLLADILSRKILYFAIKQDKTFNIEDSSLYQECISQWQLIIKEVAFFTTIDSQQRLKSRLCEKSVIEKYAAEKIYKDIKINDKEISEYYTEHIKEFTKPEQVIIRQIVLATEQDMRNLKKQYIINVNNFAEFAMKYSITPEAKKGGILGPFSKGEFPEIFDIAFQLRKGEIRYGIKSNYGFHIMMLERKIPSRTLTLQESSPIIINKLIQKYKEERYKQWLNQSLNLVKIRFYSEPFH